MKEIDAGNTKRAAAFDLWIDAPMPMVTLFKTLDVSRLRKAAEKHGYKFNMLMCWCIGKAASRMEEFYLLPVGRKLMQYDNIAVNTVIATKNGEISTCDIPFSEDIRQFNEDYLKLTGRVRETGEAYDIGDEYMVIGTSALVKYDIDAAINMYSGIYNNPFVIWSRYRRKLFKSFLTVSFQFHHTQMDGEDGARFLENVQREIVNLK